jgi:hypothetical protein
MSRPLEPTPTPEESGLEDENLAYLADYDIGFRAGPDGEPHDPENQPKAWQKGWADANE